jgi:pimeloyl-ACP methyl ester carboxylesterase
MEAHFENYRSSRIHYYISPDSSKERVLWCFHGYGESGDSFSFLEKELSRDFTIISIDFPFHGKTVWKEGLLFTPQDLSGIIGELKAHYQLGGAKTFFLGFSMGGRVALGLLPHFGETVKKIVLIAPDGLKMNGWYWLATQTVAGNKLFSFLMKNPALFLSLLHLTNWFRLINQSIYKFMDYYLHNRQVRIDLYARWTSMRKFRPLREKIKSLIRENKIILKLVYGQYDRIILTESGEKFIRGIEDFASLTVLPTGHQLLQEKNIDLLVSLLKE